MNKIIVTLQKNITEAEHAELIHFLEATDYIEEYEDIEKKDKAYVCEDETCKCHILHLWLRHCPLCGQLYSFVEENTEIPCIDCEEQAFQRRKI